MCDFDILVIQDTIYNMYMGIAAIETNQTTEFIKRKHATIP